MDETQILVGGYRFTSLEAKAAFCRRMIHAHSNSPEHNDLWRHYPMLYDHAEEAFLIFPFIPGISGELSRHETFLPHSRALTDLLSLRDRDLLASMKRHSLALWNELGPEDALSWKSDFHIRLGAQEGDRHWVNMEVRPLAFDLGERVWLTLGMLRMRQPRGLSFPHFRDTQTEQAALVDTATGQLQRVSKLELQIIYYASLGSNFSTMSRQLGLNRKVLSSAGQELAERLGYADLRALLLALEF